MADNVAPAAGGAAGAQNPQDLNLFVRDVTAVRIGQWPEPSVLTSPLAWEVFSRLAEHRSKTC